MTVLLTLPGLAAPRSGGKAKKVAKKRVVSKKQSGAKPVANPAGMLPRAGEIQLEGRLVSVDRVAEELVLEAESFTLPSGKTARLSVLRTKRIRLEQAQLRVRGPGGQVLSITDLRPGLSAIVVGKDGKDSFSARSGSFWSSEKGGKYVLESSLPAAPAILSLADLKFPKAVVPPEDRPEMIPHLGHGLWVNAVAFIDEGRTLLTFSDAIRQWDIRTRRLVKTVGFPYPYRSYTAAVSGDGSTAVMGTVGKAALIDPRSGRVLRLLETGTAREVRWVALSPDGRRALGAVTDLEPTSVVFVWDTATGKTVRTWTEDSVTALAFSPTEPLLVTATNSRKVTFRDLETGKITSSAEIRTAAGAMAFSPDGRTLAVNGSLTSEQCETTLMDVSTAEARRTLRQPGSPWLTGIGYSPDGKYLVSGGWEAVVWDASGTKELGRLRGRINASCVAFTPDSRTVATGGNLFVVHTADLPEVRNRKDFGQADGTAAIAYDPVHRWAARGGVDGTVEVWDLRTGALRHRARRASQVMHLEFSGDGNTLLSSHLDAACIWDASTLKLRRQFLLPRDLGTCVLTRDGKSVLLPTVASLEWRSLATGEVLGSLPLQTPISRMRRSPVGSEMLTNMNGVIELRSSESGEMLRQLRPQGPGVLRLAFSPSGKLAASGDISGGVNVYEVHSGAHVLAIECGQAVADLAFSRDEKTLLVSGPGDVTSAVIAWDLRTRRPVWMHRAQGGTPPVECLPDGKTLLAGFGRTLELWDVPSGSTRLQLIPTGWTGAGWLAVTADGYYECSEESDRLVQWRFGQRYVPFSAFEETYRSRPHLERALRGEALVRPLTLNRNSPAVRFLEPKSETVVQGTEVRVRVLTTDDRSVQRFRFWVNGVPIPEREVRAEPLQVGKSGTDTEPLPEGHKAVYQLTATVPLPPGEQELRLRVEAYDDEHNRGDAILTVFRPDEPEVKGDLYLLTVGVSRYANKAYNLQFAAADADALSKALAGQAGKRYARVHATRLTNAKATTSEIRKALRAIAQAKPEDTILLFFSGHGLTDGKQFYFAPHEVAPDRLGTTALPWNEVVAGLAAARGRKLLFTDACHSGGRLGRAARPASGDDLGSSTRRTGIVMLASSRGDQYSFEDEKLGHGTFTHALLEALQGKASFEGQGSVTLKQLLDYVPDRVAQLSGSRQTPWVPQLDDFNLEAPLALVGAPAGGTN